MPPARGEGRGARSRGAGGRGRAAGAGPSGARKGGGRGKSKQANGPGTPAAPGEWTLEDLPVAGEGQGYAKLYSAALNCAVAPVARVGPRLLAAVPAAAAEDRAALVEARRLAADILS